MDIKRKIKLFFAGMLILVIGLSSCTPAASTLPTGIAEANQQLNNQDSKYGGTAAISVATDPDTLDIQKSASGVSAAVMEMVGASLVTKDPSTGGFIPYLAKSWTISDDGLTLTFVLKDGIKFHDGTPLTAEDYAWTFNRAIDPKTASPVTGVLLQGLTEAKALDTLTLQLTLSQPNYYILDGLTIGGYTSPYSKAYVQSKSSKYIARHPMSVGPYIFSEWKTGDSITLVRDPDFTWGPDYSPGPRYIETVVFKIIPDQATDVAALEAGETVTTSVPTSELSRFQDTTKFSIYHTMGQTLYPALAFNLSKEPWTDIRIRQALSYAIDRQKIVDSYLQGQGEPSYGPLPPSISGYTKDVESYYNYNSAKALSLFEEAGYTKGADGTLSKDGVPLTIKLISPSYDFVVPELEIIKEQLAAIGIDLTIEALDPSLVDSTAAKGDYDLVVTGYNYNTADILYYFFHSSMIGAGTNYTVNDPALDQMLDQSRTIMDTTQHDQIVHDMQIYIMDHAYWITLVNSMGNQVVSTNLQDTYWSDPLAKLMLDSTWLKNK
jgi:peptide/nickel transport system substrate-binding protein